jgi:hypothetical protein
LKVLAGGRWASIDCGSYRDQGAGEDLQNSAPAAGHLMDAPLRPF